MKEDSFLKIEKEVGEMMQVLTEGPCEFFLKNLVVQTLKTYTNTAYSFYFEGTAICWMTKMEVLFCLWHQQEEGRVYCLVRLPYVFDIEDVRQLLAETNKNSQKVKFGLMYSEIRKGWLIYASAWTHPETLSKFGINKALAAFQKELGSAGEVLAVIFSKAGAIAPTISFLKINYPCSGNCFLLF